jgi:hypothetical protein
MDDKADQVKLFIKANNINLNEERDLRLLIDFYNAS